MLDNYGINRKGERVVKHKTINGFTKRKMINTILKENLGVQSAVETPGGLECRYRNTDGNKCVVGCFIPDSVYDKSMEGRVSSAVIKDHGLWNYMPLDTGGMRLLQEFHDDYTGKNFKKDIVKWIQENVEDGDVKTSNLASKRKPKQR